MDRIVVTSILCALCLYAFAQCPPGPLGTGQFLDKPAGCATGAGLDIMFTPIYSQLEDDSDITIDWGDGTPNDVINVGTTGAQLGIAYNTPVAHTYTEANTAGGCVYTITASVTGPNNCYTLAETTVMTDIVIWNTDNFGDGGSDLVPDPLLFTVCEGSAVAVQLTDLSPWNCTDLAVTTSVNDQERWTQWEYGVVNTITGVVLVDGNPEVYPFAGAVDIHTPPPVLDPLPPGNTSLNIDIPNTALNGQEFHVRLHNWNQCNEYDDGGAGPFPVNPSVFRDAVIRIVPPPTPAFTVEDSGGMTPAEFCINEDLFFINGTGGPGPYTYFWEFYDDNPGVTLLGTSTAANPTFQFANGGDKMIRLTATDNTTSGACVFFVENVITLAPDAVSDFEFYDAGFGAVPIFCQTGTDIFTIGFRDNTVDVAATEYRYEFYDETATVLLSTEPTSGAYLPDPVPDFTRDFSTEEYVIVRHISRNTSTFCSSFEQDTVFVYDEPTASFTADEVCEGDLTSFSNIIDEIAGIPIRVNDDIINLYEWDFDYDGITFNVDFSAANNNDFTQNLGAANTYNVGLRVTTEEGGCVSQVFELPVTVNPNPDSQLAHDATGQVCPGEEVTFTNNSNNPTLTMQYFLEVSHTPTGFFQSDPITTTLTLSFPNPDDSIRTYQSVIRAQTSDGCETVSSIESFEISPDENAQFTDLNYDFFNSNCSPWTSTLLVDAATQALAPDMYEWTLSEGGAVLAGYPVTKVSTDPDFHQLDYSITNTTNAIRSIEAVLEVTKAGVCVENDTLNLQISPQPSSDFTVLRDEDCDEVVLELEATQKGLTDYAWTFNPAPDNEFGIDDQRLISYNRDVATGSDFTVTIDLITTNLAGCPSDMTSMTETVERSKPDLTADFTLSTDTVQLPDATVDLTNISTADAGFTYEWDFGDGGTSNVRDPGSYTYTDFGSFLIRLTIMDDFCEVDTAKTIVVLPADPVIDFEADTLQGCTPLTIRFTNLSQSAVSGEFLWEFGDGSISNLDNPIHTYFDGGTYDVRLRGTNNVGVTMETEKTEYIEAFGRPFADFLVSSRIVFIPDDEVHFRNLSENSVEFFWDFGDGFTSTESDPSHAYTDEGTYDIMLVATNELGCVDTLFREAEIEAVVGGDVSSPNAFTPNLSGPNGGEVQDGLNLFSVNDIFLPRLKGVVNFRMLIYNKWGQLIFESENQNIGWDGYYKGRLAPAGVYIYKLELRYSDDRDEIKVGDVTLIR